MSSNPVRHGKPGDEMFLQRPSAEDSPTIEPLRIYKRDSRSPEPDNQTHSAAFTLPPGASSSPAPLPYPDDRQRFQPRPLDGRKTAGEQGRVSPAYPVASPPRVGSADPARPSVSEYPSALRPRGDAHPSSRLAERRTNIPKPLPDSPGPEAPDKEGLFQRLPQRDRTSSREDIRNQAQAEANPYPNYYQQYWPPPGGSTSGDSAPSGGLNVPNPAGVNRLSSTASTSTTKAQRGSPPPLKPQ